MVTLPRWFSSVVPGAFAGPWTPLPRRFPARIGFVVARIVRAGKRRGRACGQVHSPGQPRWGGSLTTPDRDEVKGPGAEVGLSDIERCRRVISGRRDVH